MLPTQRVPLLDGVRDGAVERISIFVWRKEVLRAAYFARANLHAQVPSNSGGKRRIFSSQILVYCIMLRLLLFAVMEDRISAFARSTQGSGAYVDAQPTIPASSLRSSAAPAVFRCATKICDPPTTSLLEKLSGE